MRISDRSSSVSFVHSDTSILPHVKQLAGFGLVAEDLQLRVRAGGALLMKVGHGECFVDDPLEHAERLLDEPEDCSPAAAEQVLAPDCVVPEIVSVNVGGRRLTTTRATLLRYPGSHLCQIFLSRPAPPRDAEGAFCIDRDGSTFHHILNFLRDGSAPVGITRSARLALLRETKFYGLDVLHTLIGGSQEPGDLELASRGGPVFHVGKAVRAASLTSLEEQLGRSRDPRLQVERTFRDTGLDFTRAPRSERVFARLRHGPEYNERWIVSSPRNISGVQYELHNACLGHGPLEAMNRMAQAGFKPVDFPPKIPRVSMFYTNTWEVMMYRDRPVRPEDVLPVLPSSATASSAASANVSQTPSLLPSRQLSEVDDAWAHGNIPGLLRI